MLRTYHRDDDCLKRREITIIIQNQKNQKRIAIDRSVSLDKLGQINRSSLFQKSLPESANYLSADNGRSYRNLHFPLDN